MRKILALTLVCILVLNTTPAWAATDITFVAATSDTSDSTTYTFTNHAIGTAAADRCVVVEIMSRRGAATVTTIDSVTIGGNAAAVLEQLSVEESSAASVFGIAALTVAAGTTATIVVTFSASMLRARVAVSAMTGAATCGTASQTGENEANDPTFDLDVPDDGTAVGTCGGSSAAASAAWTGLGETHDAIAESLMHMSGASTDFSSEQTNLTILCDLTGVTSGEGGVFVAWGPAVAGGAAPSRVIGGSVF